MLAALSTALLCAPVAYHRISFRRHDKGRLVRNANVMAIVGLGTVALAICGAVLLVVSVVDRGLPIPVIESATIGSFAFLWFVFPMVNRRRTPPL